MKSISFAAVIVLLICLATGCAVPLHQKWVDNVKAVGWDSNNRPVALAQEEKFNQYFMLLGPDGGMEKKYQIDRGSFVLITPDEKKKLDPKALGNWDKQRCSLEMARWNREQGCFLALVSIMVGPYYETEKIGFTVDEKGKFEQFYVAERSADYDISPDGRDLYRLWYRKDDEGVFRYPVYERIDASTGDIDGYQSPLMKEQIRIENYFNKPDSFPCQPEFSSLSPDNNQLVMSCLDDDSSSIWLFDEEQGIRSLAIVPFSVDSANDFRHPKSSFEELKFRYLYPRPTLAWSPDQSRVYYCRGLGADGYVIDVSSGEMISHSPGLLVAAWSPDGKAIAGIVDGKLTVWYPNPASED